MVAARKFVHARPAEYRKPFLRWFAGDDAETIEVVEMVLAGAINKQIVTALNHPRAPVGLSGKDGDLIIATKRGPEARAHSMSKKRSIWALSVP